MTSAQYSVKEQDRWLPIANVTAVMKNALPSNARISQDAKECMQECVGEFISFITSEASEMCQKEKRKIIDIQTILSAMQSLGFENYAEVLKVYCSRYLEEQHKAQSNRALVMDDTIWTGEVTPSEKAEPGIEEVVD